MFDDFTSPGESPRRRKSRPIVLAEDFSDDFHDDDLEVFARSAELAADNPELDLVELCELYQAADGARQAAHEKRRKRRNVLSRN